MAGRYPDTVRYGRKSDAMITLRAIGLAVVMVSLFGDVGSIAAPVAGSGVGGALGPIADPAASAACWASEDSGDEDPADVVTSAVLRAILQCGPEIGLSETQTRRVQAITDAFLRETLDRQTRITMMEIDLVAVLRPSAGDPLRPVDVVAAARNIRAIARARVEQDLALLHTIERLKWVLTAEQRQALTTLLMAPPPQRSDV